jgi:hypothetical protein
MIATIIIKGTAPARVLLTDRNIDRMLIGRLERAGYSVHECMATRLHSADAIDDAIEPMLSLDLFATVSP